jgi:CRP/FNR family transcriptional regulator
MTDAVRVDRTSATNLAAEDGDETRFCSTCVFGRVCLPHRVDKAALHELHCLVEHSGPYQPGEHVFRIGDPFNAVYAVRSGMIKTSYYDDSGREQVLGFHLPGEMVGLNAIHPAKYPCDAVALDAAYVCRFSFGALATLAARLPEVQRELFRLLSKDIGDAALLAGDYSADERLAAFLLGLSTRLAGRGPSGNTLRLSMSRADIANYLRLAAETVSRVLRRFQDRGLIKVDGRDVLIVRPAELRSTARNILYR